MKYDRSSIYIAVESRPELSKIYLPPGTFITLDVDVWDVENWLAQNITLIRETNTAVVEDDARVPAIWKSL